MSAKAEIQWVAGPNGRGDVSHIESGRVMLSDVTLYEACKHFMGTPIRAIS